MSDSSAAKVQHHWKEIRQIIADNAATQASTNKISTDALMKDMFQSGKQDGLVNTAEQSSEERGEGIVDPEDEYLVNQVLKNKLYDDMTTPPTAEDLMASTNGAVGTMGGRISSTDKSATAPVSSNQHLRYPYNTYKRNATGAEARSVRRPPGEKGWK